MRDEAAEVSTYETVPHGRELQLELRLDGRRNLLLRSVAIDRVLRGDDGSLLHVSGHEGGLDDGTSAHD